MKELSAPYIVSADAHTLVERWSKSNNLSIPELDYFEGMQNDLKSYLEKYLGYVEVVSERSLVQSLEKLVESSEYPIISLDRSYTYNLNPNKIAGHIDVTRMVNENLEDIGVQPRPDYFPLDIQINNLYSATERAVALVDDVIFTGGSMKKIIEKLNSVNRPVKQIYAAIGIDGGVEQIRQMGIKVDCVREYTEVVDEVCERDFVAGIPLSGRTVLTQQKEYKSAPYFGPFGNPEKWASIPHENVKEFSEYCIDQSATLWKKIEMLSDVKISTEKVPRKIFRMDFNHSIVEGLHQSRDLL